MYNLFISGDPLSWEGNYFELDESRFLEYSNKDIVAKYKNAIDTNSNLLIKLPCLFMYEHSVYKPAKIGYLKSVQKKNRKIIIEFDFVKPLIIIESLKIENISEILDIRDWEVNRTHWAIKEKDLNSILLNENIITSSQAVTLNSYEINYRELSTKAYKERIPKITSFNGFVDKIFEIIDESSDVEWFFRGHSNKIKYRLEPSVFRKDDNGNYLHKSNELNMFREMLLHNPHDFRDDKTTIDKLVHMQHYSLPTRLLDITSNPLIALYFSCKSQTNINEDGEVICFAIKRSSIEYYDSDTVSILSNLAMLSMKEQESLSSNWFFGVFDHSEPSYKKLKQYIQFEKPYIEDQQIEDVINRIVLVKCKENNERIASQSGAFLLFGLDSQLSENGNDDIKITRIEIREKKKILQALDKLNINERTIFPFIENTARYISEKWNCRNC